MEGCVEKKGEGRLVVWLPTGGWNVQRMLYSQSGVGLLTNINSMNHGTRTIAVKTADTNLGGEDRSGRKVCAMGGSKWKDTSSG